MSKCAVVFPGQGAQHVGMGHDFFKAFSSVKKIYQQASDMLGYDVAKLCFEGPDEALRITERTQPTILTTSLAIYEVIVQRGVLPDVMAGLSLGEYSALVAAGAIDFKDAVKIVSMRGKYMQEEVPDGVGGMAAILGLADDKVEQACKLSSEYGIVAPANYNCPKQLVIAGELKAVEKAVEKATELGALKVVILPVSAPFHTTLLKGAGFKLQRELNKYCFKSLNIPVVANIDANYYRGQYDISSKLVQQVSAPVKWSQSISKMIDDGVTTFIEIGPGGALSKFIKKIDKKVNVNSILCVDDLQKLE